MSPYRVGWHINDLYELALSLVLTPYGPRQGVSCPSNNVICATLWLRHVVAGFPTTSLQFDRRLDHVESVVDKVALELVLLRVFRFSLSGLFLKCPMLIDPRITDAVSAHKFKQSFSGKYNTS